ncbi:MAG: assimilatory sulfite reductase (NADPH) flavoprotein subunit [Verrucomicrobiota bacterium]
MQLPETAPFTSEERNSIEHFLASLTSEKKIWLSGFLAGTQATGVAPQTPSAKLPVNVLFGSESGNAEGLAQETRKALTSLGMAPKVTDLADCKPSDLAKMKHVLLITSTWGDGDPPDAVIPFHEALMADDSPRMEGLAFSVCALGDTSYEKFCQTGKDFDQRLEDLGANRISARKDCDVDFDEPYQEWLKDVTSVLTQEAGSNAPMTISTTAVNGSTTSAYGKKNPFPAPLQERILLNGRGSIKETLHLEFSLEGSGLTYQPGDSLAVLPHNASDVVEAVLSASHLNGDESVTLKDGTNKSLSAALTQNFDITGLSRSFIQNYNEVLQSEPLAQLLENKETLQDYIYGRQIVDLLQAHPCEQMDAQTFIGLLRKLPPRLYSIASSLKAHPDEVHLTVAAVRYNSHGRDRKGVASTFLADLVNPGDSVPVFVTPNKHFKVPQASDTSAIMVGPGTGVAPFRAFIEERAANGDTGKNWLFFGDQRYSYDFLYQTEWQEHLSSGTLSRLDLAFSRDQKEKVYVQHRMLERGEELWQWLQDGANFYVCGDASRMAHDVHEALIKIAESHGNLDREAAEAYVTQLQKDKRYLRDVY